MITARAATRGEIAAVMFDRDIFDRTNSDGSPPIAHCDMDTVNLTGWSFIGGFVEGKIASLFIVKGEQLHFWVLKPFRRHARELLAESFKLWPRDVWCEIPVLYQSVINFAKNNGFVEDGIRPASFIKNGKTYNKIILRFKWAI